MARLKPASGFVLAVAGAISLWGAQATANDELMKMQQDPKQWVMPIGNYSSTRYSALAQINKENVEESAGRLDLLDRRAARSRGRPAGDRRRDVRRHAPFPNMVFALDLNDDGQMIWKYEPKQDPNVIPVMCCDTVNRGVAYGDGKIFLHQADTTVVALDAKTGEVVWRSRTAIRPRARPAPRRRWSIKDKVLVGDLRRRVRRARPCHRLQHQGRQAGLAGYSSGSGRRDADRPGEDHRCSASRSARTAARRPGKATSGRSAAARPGAGCPYDPELNLIYYGTGNPSTWNPVQRPGDNRWSMTIFARDADTGMAKWVYQMTPHDEWDYDGVNEMILADIKVERQGRARRWSTSTATASATPSTATPASCWSPRSTIRR